MAQYRHNLPQLANDLFLTDGGIETTLIFREGFDLHEFAAFDLLKNFSGHNALKKYFCTYETLAQSYQVGLILESTTWRANRDWGAVIGYSPEALADMNRKAIDLLHDICQDYETEESPMIISGCIGPRGDGYSPNMTADQAFEYHHPQIQTFCEAESDLVTAITMNYVEEAIGITLVAETLDIPIVISFTVETDGHLPTGQSLKEAINQVDQTTSKPPAYYMINCAHPTHFASVLTEGEPWIDHICGIRANASAKSHAQLDASDTLDDGNPQLLGNNFRNLKAKLKNLTVLGGCCGTDERHIDAICNACLPLFWTHLTTGKQLPTPLSNKF